MGAVVSGRKNGAWGGTEGGRERVGWMWGCGGGGEEREKRRGERWGERGGEGEHS